jgi:hypothetical protein
MTATRLVLLVAVLFLAVILVLTFLRLFVW